MPGLDGLPDVAEHLNADAMAVRVVIRDETRATGSVPYRWLRSKKNSCGDSSDHRPTLAAVEQARRGTSHLKASAPKLKHGSMAARHWMILKREIAFEQIGNGDRQRPYARWRPPTFRNVYSPKTPQSPSEFSKASGLNDWNRWRSLGDSNPCFRRERANKPACHPLKHSRVATGRPFRRLSAHRDNRPKPASS